MLVVLLRSPLPLLKWTDRELDGYIREAVQFFNRYAPEDVVVSSTFDYLASDTLKDFIEVTDVLVDLRGQLVSLQRFQRRRYASRVPTWDWNGTQLRLTGSYPTTTAVEIHGLRRYPVPQTDHARLEIHQDDWEILSIYAQGRAYMRLAGQSAQLDRWKEEGKRNDNPITPVARMLLTRAEEMLLDRRSVRPTRRYQG